MTPSSRAITPTGLVSFKVGDARRFSLFRASRTSTLRSRPSRNAIGLGSSNVIAVFGVSPIFQHTAATGRAIILVRCEQNHTGAQHQVRAKLRA